MLIVPLDNVPNQKIGFNIDGAFWQLYIYSAIEHMCCDISRNGNILLQGVRCFGGIKLIPYNYMQSKYGNFIFNIDADWELFGDKSFLYYLNSEEIKEFEDIIEKGLLFNGDINNINKRFQ